MTRGEAGVGVMTMAAGLVTVVLLWELGDGDLLIGLVMASMVLGGGLAWLLEALT